MLEVAPPGSRQSRETPTRIAIDGPVSAGKTTVGRLLARRLGYRFLDTGLMYRALTRAAIDRGVPAGDRRAVNRLARDVTISTEFTPDGEARVLVDGVDVTDSLRDPEVDRAVSQVSEVPEVRARLVALQRQVAEEAPIVMVGRDIGTIVLPDAELKVFLTARVETRARRRHRQFIAAGKDIAFAEVLASLSSRDRRDASRDASPLRRAEGARLVETDDLTLEETVAEVAKLAEAR